MAKRSKEKYLITLEEYEEAFGFLEGMADVAKTTVSEVIDAGRRHLSGLRSKPGLPRLLKKGIHRKGQATDHETRSRHHRFWANLHMVLAVDPAGREPKDVAKDAKIMKGRHLTTESLCAADEAEKSPLRTKRKSS